MSDPTPFLSARSLSTPNINQKVVSARYAVRGKIVAEAEKIERELSVPHLKSNLKFDEVIYCNIGNPQKLKQRPITFFRQVLSLIEYPDLFKDPSKLEITKKLYPEDAIERAKELLSTIKGGVGAYSTSQGVYEIRKHVSQFILKRDGVPSNPDDIFLTEGASGGVSLILRTLIRNEKDGILVPIPQYPLYSASIQLLGGALVGYELEEEDSDNPWGLKIETLQSLLDNHVSSGGECRALVVINPGNPTGQCLSKENMQNIVKFCYKNRIILLADEVYQKNTYQEPFWISFKQVIHEMEKKYHNIELVSYHSTSKGMVGECGKRGGYMELQAFDPEVQAQLVKLSSISLCPNLIGQCVVDLMVKPPQEGDSSYPLYHEETVGIFNSLKRRSETLATALNELEGITCSTPQGAMYLFPKIELPQAAVDYAISMSIEPDYFYALELLRHTGICSVPGSGFKQRKGTFHVRLTFLPPEESIAAVVARLKDFHTHFMEKYAE